ncbi:MAG: SEC-C domain-containing protein [Elusimicrobia bacterium]|nr:SEC-C domain-containing protein [Elusimicrobiota bacterium]
MVWGFFKDKISKIKDRVSDGKFEKKSILSSDDNSAAARQGDRAAVLQAGEKAKGDNGAEKKSDLSVKTAEKEIWEKTDDELAGELNKISPEILAQAKTPKMRKTIIDVYRKMLKDGVNVNSDREVKRWLKKHPQALQGGEEQKIETFKRTEIKIGRNDPCSCGSGKKYKKCCGK